MRRPSRGELFRLWVQQRREAAGLVLAIVVLTAVVIFAAPWRYDPPTEALIVGFAPGTGRASSMFALVRTPEGDIRVPILIGDNCRIGGRIHLLRQRFPWGRGYAAAAIPC